MWSCSLWAVWGCLPGMIPGSFLWGEGIYQVQVLLPLSVVVLLLLQVHDRSIRLSRCCAAIESENSEGACYISKLVSDLWVWIVESILLANSKLKNTSSRILYPTTDWSWNIGSGAVAGRQSSLANREFTGWKHSSKLWSVVTPSTPYSWGSSTCSPPLPFRNPRCEKGGIGASGQPSTGTSTPFIEWKTRYCGGSCWHVNVVGGSLTAIRCNVYRWESPRNGQRQ